jgi:predicted Na+-dependent transporter
MDWIALAGNILLFALVFGMSATVDINCMKEQVRNRGAILTGIALQFVVLPLLGFAVVNIMNLPHGLGITLLVLTSSPGGSYSNWWCSMFNADLALSVTMTAISTVLSTVMLPLNLLVYAKYSYEADVIAILDWMSLFVALVIVISAIALGLCCSAKVHSHKFNLMANRVSGLLMN